MKYHQVLPTQNNNVSHRQPWRELILLVTATAVLVFTIYSVIGFFVNRAVDVISPQLEATMFASIDTGQWLGSQEWEVSSDPAMQQLVDGLSQCAAVSYPLKVQLVKSDQINALAVPGGRIVFFSGLLMSLQSENALAFVLAHEIAHFKHRDHLRAMGRGVVFLAMSMVFTGANSDLSQLIVPVSRFNTAQFSQAREEAADAAALDIIHCYYGHVGGATELFEVLANQDLALPVMHYFSSHPEARQRIATINSLARSKGYAIGATIDR